MRTRAESTKILFSRSFHFPPNSSLFPSLFSEPINLCFFFQCLDSHPRSPRPVLLINRLSPIFSRWKTSVSTQNPNSRFVLSIPSCNRSITTSSTSDSNRRSSSSSRRPGSNPRSRDVDIDSDLVGEIVEFIRRDEEDLESNLNQKNLRLSHPLVVEILHSVNDNGISALRFFNWSLNSSLGFKPSSEIYNLVVDNIGRIDDFKTMFLMLKELSLKGHCLTDKAFTFLTYRSSITLKDSVGRVTEILNKVGGSCRGSGIHSLIKLLCKMGSFHLAIFVMEQTARRTSYYNVLIATKCRHGDFQGARDVLDEMKRFGCDPDTKSYNYLLGGLFKNKRVAEACDLMQAMEESGYLPDSITFEVVASPACKENRMDFAVEVINRMLYEGIKPRMTMHAMFIKAYFWFGRVEDAYKYVIEMSTRDKYSVNLNYSLLARLFWLSGRVVEAGGILYEMMEKGLKPNFPVYVKVIKDLHKINRGDLSLELKSKFSQFNSSARAG